MGAFALTEPDAGSDARAIQTRAELKDGEWVINGTKIFITNAGLKNSMGMVLMAVTGEDENGRKEVSSIIVPRDTPGFIAGGKFKKVGWNIMDTRELIFKDCRVPESNLFGARGKGLHQALGGLNLGRIDFGAIGTGVAQAALDHSLKYAKQRVQFGRPISKNQVVAFMLADMACNVETSRMHTYRAAWLKDNGKPHEIEATMAKLTASENANKNVGMGFQIHGGSGFVKDYEISRLYRNVKILDIGEGTSEICRLVISRSLGC
jgi:butyryl-CoA dehydrogenase